MEWFMVLIVVVPVIVAIFAAVAHSDQKNAFVALGNIVGKPMADIIAAVGPPTSISAAPNGQLYQWLKTSLAGHIHYAILADMDRKAVGYTHQSVS